MVLRSTGTQSWTQRGACTQVRVAALGGWWFSSLSMPRQQCFWAAASQRVQGKGVMGWDASRPGLEQHWAGLLVHSLGLCSFTSILASWDSSALQFETAHWWVSGQHAHAPARACVRTVVCAALAQPSQTQPRFCHGKYPSTCLSLCLQVPAVALLHCAGGYFDPLGLASDNDPDKVFRLKTAEIKHGRLAMVAFLGEWGMLYRVGRLYWVGRDIAFDAATQQFVLGGALDSSASAYNSCMTM